MNFQLSGKKILPARFPIPANGAFCRYPAITFLPPFFAYKPFCRARLCSSRALAMSIMCISANVNSRVLPS